RGVLMQGDDRAGREFEQGGRDAVVVGIEHLDLDARKLGGLPGHVGHIEIMRGALRRILRIDVGMHDLALWLGHGRLPWRFLSRSSLAVSLGDLPWCFAGLPAACSDLAEQAYRAPGAAKSRLRC